MADPRKLSLKQQKFCLAYCGEANGNATESARIAGYKGNDGTLRNCASVNLTKSNIVTRIAQLRAKAEIIASDKILSAAEVRVGLSRIASADIADVLEPDGSLDLQKAKERGVSRLIKTLKYDKDTGRIVHFELYNAHVGFQDMGKAHGIFLDKVEHSGEVVVSENPEQRIEASANMIEEWKRRKLQKTA